MSENKSRPKEPIEHLNIAEFNRGQSSKLVRDLVAEDKIAFIQKHGKPMALIISYERYKRLLESEVDINEY